MHQVPRKGRYSVRKFIEKYGRSGNMTKWREQLNGDCPKRDASPSKNTPAAFLRARHRLADSGLRLDPCAGCRFGLERTGERMLGAAQRHADEKTWHVVCAHPVLIEDECDEHLVSHCAARAAFAPFARARLGVPRPAG